MEVVNNMHVEDELGLSLFVRFFLFFDLFFQVWHRRACVLNTKKREGWWGMVCRRATAEE